MRPACDNALATLAEFDAFFARPDLVQRNALTPQQLYLERFAPRSAISRMPFLTKGRALCCRYVVDTLRARCRIQCGHPGGRL
jgi:hypothetical protein